VSRELFQLLGAIALFAGGCIAALRGMAICRTDPLSDTGTALSTAGCIMALIGFMATCGTYFGYSLTLPSYQRPDVSKETTPAEIRERMETSR
jgi:hypothetical protein